MFALTMKLKAIAITSKALFSEDNRVETVLLATCDTPFSAYQKVVLKSPTIWFQITLGIFLSHDCPHPLRSHRATILTRCEPVVKRFLRQGRSIVPSFGAAG